MAYLIRRGAIYYLNLRLPKHPFPSSPTLRISLHIRERQSALFTASFLAQQVYQYISTNPTVGMETLRSVCMGWRDGVPISNSTAQSRTVITRHKTDGPTLAELAKMYLAEGKAGGTWRPVSTLEVERSLRDLFDLLGDMPAAAFDVHHARLLKDRLSRCPQYFALQPQFKGKALLDVVESGAVYKTITSVTVNNRLRKHSAFLSWCKSNGYIAENPLLGIKAKTGIAKDARLSFETSDLDALLNLAVLERESTKCPWRYWLPLLGRFTGARLEELCQLRVSDFIIQQNIQCIRIDDGHESQNLKNSSSRRILPVHPTLISLGLMSHVKELQDIGKDRIFPELMPVRGKLGHAPSKWFGRYRAKMGVTDPRKTFHSFRHTMIDDLRDGGVQDSLIKRIAGHEDAATSFRVYGSRIPMKAMAAAMMHIPSGGLLAAEVVIQNPTPRDAQ